MPIQPGEARTRRGEPLGGAIYGGEGYSCVVCHGSGFSHRFECCALQGLQIVEQFRPPAGRYPHHPERRMHALVIQPGGAGKP